MKKSFRLAALAVVASVGMMIMAPTAAHAGKSGRRNTALALGAVAAYGLIKKKPAIAGVAGAGAVYSWIRSNQVDENRNRNRNRNRRRYNTRYRGDRYYNNGYYDNGYRRGYSNSGYRPVYSNSYDRNCNTGRSYSRSVRNGNGNRYGHYKNRGKGRKHWK